MITYSTSSEIVQGILTPIPCTVLRRGVGLPGFENWSDFVLEFLNEFRIIAEISVGDVQHSDLA